MGLNIKNERVHELARRAAEVTGKSQTGAIETALERLLRDYDVDPAGARAQQTIARIRSIANEYRNDPGRPAALRRVEDLYDDTTGLPR